MIKLSQYKGLFLVLALLLSASAIVLAQKSKPNLINGCPQPPNNTLEEWDIWTEKSNGVQMEYSDPWGWNSSSCVDFGGTASQKFRNRSIWRVDDIRPGSKGKYSAYIGSTQSTWYDWLTLWSIGAHTSQYMGTMTTGLMWFRRYHGDKNECIFTKRDNEAYNWPFNGRPDSVVFWVKVGQNNGISSELSMYLHDNSPLEDKGGNLTAKGNVIGEAYALLNYENGDWYRVSLPIKYKSNATPAYLLMSFTAGSGGNFISVASDCHMKVDDILFVYNPTLTMGTISQNKIEIKKDGNTTLAIPYTIKGTMSPYNNLPDNKVEAFLVSKDGKEVKIGSQTTNLSGTLNCIIPKNTVKGTYTIKLRSTNYPLEAKQTKQIEIDYSPELKALKYTYSVSHYPVSGGEAKMYNENREEQITFGHGDMVILQATPDESAYSFRSWVNTKDVISYLAPLSTEKEYVWYATEDNKAFQAHFDTLKHEIAFEARPTEAGTVTQGGEYKHFRTATSTATANKYYTFSHWEKKIEDSENQVVGKEESLSVEVLGAATYVAVFSADTYVVKTAPSNALAGTTTGDSVYTAAVVCEAATVEAKAADNLYFTHWTYSRGEEENLESKENPFRFVENAHVEHNYNFVAHFDTVERKIEFLLSNENYGSLNNQGGNYKHYSKVGSQASPVEYVSFSHWSVVKKSEASSGSAEEEAAFDTANYSYDETITVDVDGDATYIAYFKEDSAQIIARAQDEAKGSAEGSAKISSFVANTGVKVEAIPVYGYDFDYWTYSQNAGAASSIEENPYVFSQEHIVGTHEFVAHFKEKTYSLELRAENGKIEGSNSYKYKETASLNAVADYGYKFKEWQNKNGEVLGVEESLEFVVERDSLIVAVFEKRDFALQLLVNDPSLGSIKDMESLAKDYKYQEKVDLQAIALDGSEIRSFVVNGDTVCKDTETLEVLMDGEKTVEAVFSIKRKSVSVLLEPELTAKVSGEGLYEHGSENIAVKISPKEGFRFVSLSRGGEVLSDVLQEEKTYTYIIDKLEEDLELRANLEQIYYDLCVSSNEGGYVDYYLGDAEAQKLEEKFCTRIKHREDIKLSARSINEKEYTFKAWVASSDTTNVLSKEKDILLFAESDTSIMALFEEIRYNIYAAAEPNEAADIEGTGAYKDGEKVELWAKARYGYQFEGWYNSRDEKLTLSGEASEAAEETTEASEEGKIVVEVNGASAFYFAKFTAMPHEVVLVSADEEMGSVVGGGTKEHGSLLKMEAIAKEGYELKSFQDKDGNVLCSDDIYYHKVVKDDTIFVHFGLRKIKVDFRILPFEEAGLVQVNPDARAVMEILYNSEVNLRAVGAEGYRFKAWKDSEGNEICATADFSLLSDKDTVFVVEFEPSDYALRLLSMPEGAGRLQGENYYKYAAEANIDAIANENYSFRYWADTFGEIKSYASNYKFKVDGDDVLVAHFLGDRAAVEIKTEPFEAGRVEVEGEQRFGETIELRAVAAPGYVFSSWSTGETTENLSYKIESTTSEISANFEYKPIALKVDIYPEGAGKLEGYKEIYSLGENVNLRAIASPGYVFYAYTSTSDSVISFAAMHNFKIEKDSEIKLVFVPDKFDLQLLSANPELGGVKGSGKYSYKDVIDIEAYAFKDVFEFSHWSLSNNVEEDTVSVDANHSHTVDNHITLYAHFKLKELAINISQDNPEAGTVTIEGERTLGSTVNLSAKAAQGYYFAGYSINGSIVWDEADYSFEINGEVNLKAEFLPVEYTISLDESTLPEGVRIDGLGKYKHGEEVVLNAILPQNLEIKAWVLAESGAELWHANSYTFTAEKDLELSVLIAEKIFRLSLSTDEIYSAILKGSGDYKFGSYATISAQSTDDKYKFVGFREDGVIVSKTSPYEYYVINNANIVALFSDNAHDIKLSLSVKEAGVLNGEGSYIEGEEVVVSARANRGYEFAHWIENGEVVSTESTYRFKASSSRMLTAVFNASRYKLSLSSFPINAGSAKGAGIYSSVDIVELSAVANQDYVFEGYYTGDDLLSKDANYSFAMKADMDIVAKFAPKNPSASEAQVERSFSYNVYPSLFRNEIHVKGYGLQKIEIYNSLGFKVLEKNLSGSVEAIINTTALPSESYVYRIFSEDGSKACAKIIKY